MARVARFTHALPVYVTQEMRDRILRLADDNDVSQAEVVRDILEVGLDEAEERWRQPISQSTSAVAATMKGESTSAS